MPISHVLRSLSVAAFSVLTLWACRGTSLSPARANTPDFFGLRFLCHDSSSMRLCLPVLKTGCSLTIAPGDGLPREPADRLLLVCQGESFLVEKAQDMADRVTIENEGDALEYVRFFSSYETVHLFSEKILEVHRGEGSDKDCFATCLPASRWVGLGLSDPAVRRVGQDFEVTRYVIKPLPNYYEVSLFRIVQRVGAHGLLEEVSSDLVNVPLEDRLGLSFPQFL